MDNNFFLQIALAKGIGDAAIKRALDFFSENADASWELLCSDLSMQILIFKNKQEIIDSIALQKETAQRIADGLERNGVKIVFFNDETYPNKLKLSLGTKCPPFLFYKGNFDLINKSSVGFCGSRNASLKGNTIARDCASQLANCDVVVISGYAKGVDMAAHKAALMNSGETIFVLAEGILTSTRKKDVRDWLTSENHLFISQFLPEMDWHAGNAMKRNSVIIGLSDAMILVESGEAGGTFAAGNETLSLNHPLFVIDFAQPEVSAKANPFFISKGGIPIKGKNGMPNLKDVYAIIKDRRNNQVDYQHYDSGQLKLSIGL